VGNFKSNTYGGHIEIRGGGGREKYLRVIIVREKKKQEVTENLVLNSVTICTLRQIEDPYFI